MRELVLDRVCRGSRVSKLRGSKQRWIEQRATPAIQEEQRSFAAGKNTNRDLIHDAYSFSTVPRCVAFQIIVFHHQKAEKRKKPLQEQGLFKFKSTLPDMCPLERNIVIIELIATTHIRRRC